MQPPCVRFLLYKQNAIMEIQQKINALESRQLELHAIMSSSDDRAAKCMKMGVQFRETDPEDFAQYEAANAEYNRNEVTLASLREQATCEAAEEALRPAIEP